MSAPASNGITNISYRSPKLNSGTFLHGSFQEADNVGHHPGNRSSRARYRHLDRHNRYRHLSRSRHPSLPPSYNSLLKKPTSPHAQSEPCTAPDCPSGHPFSGTTCKNRTTFTHFSRKTPLEQDLHQTDRFAWRCKTLMYANRRQNSA